MKKASYFQKNFFLLVTERKTIVFKNSRISYLRFGHGPAPLLCFHGYGEESHSFEFLGKHIGNQFTAYAIDMPFHGHTEWKEGINFTPTDLLQLTTLMLAEHPTAVANQRFSLLGFSMGCRVALTLYEYNPAAVEKMVLLAPDGLKVNFWYWLATQTWAGNKLFGFTMKHPGWFFTCLKMLNRVKLVNASIFKFVKHYIDNTEVRRLLYTRWTTLRKISPSLAIIKEQIKKNSTVVHLVYGKHDRIILSSVGEKFRTGIEDYCSLQVIHAGHQVLHEKHLNEILEALV